MLREVTYQNPHELLCLVSVNTLIDHIFRENRKLKRHFYLLINQRNTSVS